MAAQIGLSIALISTVLVLGAGYVIETRFVRQLRETNQLMLITRLAFIRDDLLDPGFDFSSDPQALVDVNQQRVHRLQAALFDGDRHLIAASAHFPMRGIDLPAHPVNVEDVARELTRMPIDQVRDHFASATSIWSAADGLRYRTLVGRLAIPVPGRAPREVIVALAIETHGSLELQRDDERRLAFILVAALVTSIVVGIWIARRIVVGAKRMSAAASRVGAQALDARLPLDGTPTELRESIVAFNGMLDRLQLAFERLSAFSSDLAHDLRTPIGNLLGEAQVALSRPRTADEYRAVLESAVEEYERMSRMIGNMLFLARADNAQAVVTRESLDVHDALERVKSYFELIAEERAVTLAVADGEAVRGLTVWADETLLIRAVSNLVSNAVRHADPGSTVDLAARAAAGGGTCIEVVNVGHPVPEAARASIFERFYRVDQSREHSSSSSGLGLAIVRSIMDLHRGKAEMESGRDRRTTFRLVFPAPDGS